MIEVIPAPRRLAPTQTLFAAAQSASSDGSRWGDGVEFVSDCGPTGITVPGCDPEDVYTFDDLGTFSTVRARATLVWVGRKCSALTGDSEVLSIADSAAQALEIDRHRQLESEFWTGALAQVEGWDLPDGDVAGQPFLSNPDTLTQLDTTGLPLSVAYGELAAALGSCNATGRGFVHVSRRVMVRLVDLGIVRREGTSWRDPFDNIVVAGAGYDGSGPVAGEWLYATGPVEARFGARFTTGLEADQIDRNTNTREVRAMEFAGAWFDPCCHLGIVTDLCAETCPA